MKLYQKLNFKHIQVDLDRIKSLEKKAYGKTFFEYNITDHEYLKEILNQTVEFKIAPDRVNITEITYPGAMPHTDAWSVGLNYYFDAGSDETFYFNDVDKNITPVNIKETNVKMYDINNLIVVDKFLANRNEWYIINTTVPHAVRCHAPGTIRTMLRFVWYKHDFDTILNSIVIKN